ncbi:unnamed protein product [Thelazia callipaeda]|uniref:ARID domain-containing protein n=1 Tax=Thelazia callipaeda TaxID=103827 RepID=A0A0N5D1W2_THECL|nr:unnamed protein product [Thelazia callipaeda]
MNENYLKYYFNFERPPFAPTFFPSVEEFADPISYIAKIKGDAEKYGVVKIRPPAFFRPPFAINGKNFNFTPRVQKLNQIDALVRAKLIFDAQLAGFWLMQGQTLEMPTIENKLVDLHSLYTVVVKYGGPNVMDAQKLWGTATKRLGFKQQRANKMKAVYFRWIHDFYALINVCRFFFSIRNQYSELGVLAVNIIVCVSGAKVNRDKTRK